MEATERKLKGQKFKDSNFQNILNEFLLKSSDILQGLKIKFSTFTQTWLDTLSYFGEDPSEHYNIEKDHNDPSKEGKKSPIYIFVSFDLFFHSFKDAIANARAEMEKKKNSESQKLKKKALMNASPLDSELSTSTVSDSNISIASTVTVKKAGSSEDIFDDSELEKAREKIVHRMSSQLGVNQIAVDSNSRKKTDSILANAAKSLVGIEEPEFVLRRSILLSQSKNRSRFDRNMQDVRRSINLSSFKFEESEK
jgi:hypothetical protein